MVHVCINIFSLLFALLKIIIIALVHIFQLLHLSFHLQHAFMIQLIQIKIFKRYIYLSSHFTLHLRLSSRTSLLCLIIIALFQILFNLSHTLSSFNNFGFQHLKKDLKWYSQNIFSERLENFIFIFHLPKFLSSSIPQFGWLIIIFVIYY